MSGICIDKLPHECGTKKGLQVFANPETGDVNGFCFSCSTFVPDPYGEPKKVDDIDLPPPKIEEQIEEEIHEVSLYPVVDLPTRKLRAKHLDNFGVKVSMSEHDGKTPTATYFPITKKGKISGYYVKTLGKDSYTFSIGDVKGGDPFGWEQARRSGGYKLIITEGKEDAVAAQAIFDRFGDAEWMPAVISLPNGTNSVDSSLLPHATEINSIFKEVVLAFDMDDAGQRAVEKALAILPKAKVALLPENDVNDCILKGASKAAYKAMAFNGQTPKNTRVLSAKDIHAMAREPTPFGELTWPFETLNKWMRNIRLGDTIYIGAGVKMGKSEILNTIAAHMIKNGWPVFLAKPEEDYLSTYKRIAGKIVHKIFHKPDVEFDYGAYDRAGEIIGDKLDILDLYQHVGWETLRQDIVYAAKNGAKAVFIDPITNLTAGMGSGDANTKLEAIAQDASALAKDLNIVIFFFVHLKAPEGNISQEQRAKQYRNEKYIHLGNCAHERGGTIYSNQFAGSRAMMRSCNLMLALEGNKDPDLPEHIQNMRWLTVLEDREFGNVGSVPLYYNPKTETYKEA